MEIELRKKGKLVAYLDKPDSTILGWELNLYSWNYKNKRNSFAGICIISESGKNII